MDLQKQIDALEERLKELENKPPTRGPQGRPGDISAAMHNAELASKKVTDEHSRYVRDSINSYTEEHRDQVKQLHTKISDIVAGFNERYQEQNERFFRTLDDQLANSVVKLLHDYYLLEDGAPTAKYMAHEIKAIVKEFGTLAVNARLKELGLIKA